MNINELYEYVRRRTGLGWFHIGLEEEKTEFTEKEAEEIAQCVESVCKMQTKRKAKCNPAAEGGNK
ncbi:hypothetical protein OBV_43310 [Oscillibacter valericigenes Sjm18-20]|nr:hypothetical protein OBV_43310 [Oscillibacter valericigenes Sjm18-20]